EGTTHLAPSNGRVTNLALQPGVRATTVTANAVMSFIQEDDPWVLAFYHQNELRYVEPGNEAEIFMETYPGRIIKCKVDWILWATAQGQMPISGNLPNTQPMPATEQRIALRLLVEPRDRGIFLAAGVGGAGATSCAAGCALFVTRNSPRWSRKPSSAIPTSEQPPRGWKLRAPPCGWRRHRSIRASR